MSKTYLGVPNAVLALFPPVQSAPAWNPDQPAHNWADPAAAAFVAAGNPGQIMTYCCFGGMNGATELTQLPTFTVTAAEAAAANYPAKVVVQGTQSFPANAAGEIPPGSSPMVFTPTPLRQLEPNEDIETEGPFAVPAVVLNEPTAPTSVLGTVPQPNYMTQGNQAFILETLAVLLAAQPNATAAAENLGEPSLPGARKHSPLTAAISGIPGPAEDRPRDVTRPGARPR